MGRFINYVTKKMMGQEDVGHGPMNRESETYVDNVPWDTILSNGIFRDYNGRVLKYYLAPEDVQTEWGRDASDPLHSQAFFGDTLAQLGMTINNQVDRLRGDTRRGMHIQATYGEIHGVRPPSNFSERHADYMRRLGSGQLIRPSWNVFVGLEILPSEHMYEAHGFQEVADRWIDSILNPNEADWLELARDLQQVDQIMFQHGFEELDFDAWPDDMRALTAWFAEDDYRYHMPASLRTSNFGEFVHGKSILTPKYGEIQFNALKARDGISIQDPISPNMQWAKSLFVPSNDVVAISIRGEIRAPKISSNFLELKQDKRQERIIGELDEGAQVVMQAIQSARASVAERGYPVIDNAEVVIASRVPDIGKDNNNLREAINNSQFEMLLLKDRQVPALMSTIAGYPKGVLRAPRGSKKRPHLSNVFLPGIIGMSGLFRSHRPAASSGIFLGFSLAGNEYREIYTEMDAASKYNSSPVIYISGRPGSGKTQEALQMLEQMSYENLPVWYLNLKKEESLKPVFDLIGGFTLSMNREQLVRSPGMMDPKFFLKHPEDIQSIISSNLFSAMRMYSSADGETSTVRRQIINREILERARDPRNKTTYDILFGNNVKDPRYRTDPISDASVLSYVENAIETSPFWRAFVARAENRELADQVKQGASLLVEWDQSMTLPGADKDPKDYTDDEIDMVNSAVTIFRYATDTVAGSGGGVFVDESHALKGSEEARRILNQAAREWRSADIVLVLMSQRLTDWLGSPDAKASKIGQDNLSSFVERYIIMSISENDDEDVQWFYRITGVEESDAYRNFITDMGMRPERDDPSAADSSGRRRSRRAKPSRPPRIVPYAWVHDQIEEWSGPVLCGPFPDMELEAGKTDKKAAQARREQTEAYMQKFTMKGFEEAAEELRSMPFVSSSVEQPTE